MARIVDHGVAARDLTVVLRYGLLMLTVAGIGAVGATGRNIIASIVSYRFGARLRDDLFHRVTSFSFAEMGTFDAASLITRQTNDITQVQTFVNGVMRFFVKAPILAIGGLVMAVILEPGLSVVLAVAIPIAAALIIINLATGFPRFRRVQEALDGVNSVTREYLGGIRVVKAFGQEGHEVGKFAGANGELTGASTFALRAMALFGPAIALAVNAGIVAVLWIGGYRVASSSLQVGKIIAFINYMSQILFSLNVISMIFVMFVRARASWERVAAVLGTPATEDLDAAPPPTPVAAAAAADGPPTDVQFIGISFAYPGTHGRLVLEGVDLSCARGGITAIIGPTGSGKSSLAALVPRFYEPTEGAVLVGRIDVREHGLRDLRRRIALVPQKTVLFTGTIEENLRWGRQDATEVDLRTAAAAAQAHEFIAGFPEGYQTMLGRGGVNLSGGQKQRVAIARALVRRPDVLILDDCTSSVDSITEAEILRAIRGFGAGSGAGSGAAPGAAPGPGGGCTCLLITQRISAAAAADLVLVLEDGKAVGVGHHESLVRECAVYRDICIAQLGGESVNA